MDTIDKLNKEFIELNKPNWSDIKSSKPKILVEGFLNVPNYLIAAATTARAINEVKNYEPIVIISGNSEDKAEVEKIFESYGIKNYINIRKYKFNIIFLLKSVIATIKIYIKNPNLDEFINYELNNIKIGDLIYDTYIRHSNRYVKIKLWSLSFLKELLKSHFKFYLYYYLIRNYDFKYMILSHGIYVAGGILARIGIRNGSKVMTSRITNIRCYYNYDEIFTDEFKPSKELINFIIEKKLYTKTDEFLKKRLAGNIEQQDAISAYKNKKLYSREEFCKELKLNSSFPIVFIMVPSFSDSPHASESMLSRDYYQWFVETIKYINEIKNVNWIIKPHPLSYMYNETGEVERTIKKLKLDNIYLTPSNFSTASVFNIAKTVVTVRGTIGLEAACLGIKPVIAGRAIYSDFGIACEPKNKSEYFSLLKNIRSIITLLNEQEIITAKAIFYWRQVGAFPDSTILPKRIVLPSPDPKLINKQKEENYRMIIENLKNNNPKNDPYYLHTKKMIKENKKYLTAI